MSCARARRGHLQQRRRQQRRQEGGRNDGSLFSLSESGMRGNASPIHVISFRHSLGAAETFCCRRRSRRHRHHRRRRTYSFGDCASRRIKLGGCWRSGSREKCLKREDISSSIRKSLDDFNDCAWKNHDMSKIQFHIVEVLPCHQR